jgi:hypothetical protein
MIVVTSRCSIGGFMLQIVAASRPNVQDAVRAVAASDPQRRKAERPLRYDRGRDTYLGKHSVEIDPAVSRQKGREPPLRLRELTLAADAVPAARLVPRDCDMDEALEEVLLRRVGGPPGVLERLVRLEVLAGPHQLDAAREIRVHERERMPVG